MHLGYLIMQHPYGVPFTLSEAYPFVQSDIVALGFPDIVFTPKNAYCALYEKMAATKADIVLGLFPAHNKEKWDLVDLDKNGKIKDISIKQNRAYLEFSWTIALWNPTFTQYMHEFVGKRLIGGEGGKTKNRASTTRELYPGDIILNAIKEGLEAEVVIFRNGTCIDLGTRNDLSHYLNL